MSYITLYLSLSLVFIKHIIAPLQAAETPIVTIPNHMVNEQSTVHQSVSGNCISFSLYSAVLFRTLAVSKRNQKKYKMFLTESYLYINTQYTKGVQKIFQAT